MHNFHDDPDYLQALVHDYLEAMGEVQHVDVSSPINNLLVEYDTPQYADPVNEQRMDEEY